MNTVRMVITDVTRFLSRSGDLDINISDMTGDQQADMATALTACASTFRASAADYRQAAKVSQARWASYASQEASSA